MNKLKFIFMSAAFAALTGCFILTSCSDNDDSDSYVDEEATDDNSIAYDDESKFLYDCEWHVTDSKYRTALEERMCDNDDNQIIVIDNEYLRANKAYVNQCFENGKLIIVCAPDFDLYNSLAEDTQWPTDNNDEEESLLYAFSQWGSTCLLAPEDVTIIQNPESAEGSDFGDITATGGDDVPEQKPMDPSDLENLELKYYLGGFVQSINSMYKASGTRAEAEEKMHYIKKTKEEVITWPIGLYFAKTKGSDWDYLSSIYQAGVKYEYEPLYVFSGNNDPGDYYIVTAYYISYAGTCFKGEDLVRSHGAVDVHYTGAYLRELNVNTYIAAEKGKSNGGAPDLIGSAVPGSNINTTNYSFTNQWNIGGGLTGGLFGSKGEGIGLSGDVSFNWGLTGSSTISYAVSDLNVANYTYKDGTNGHVPSWKFWVGNLPRKKGTRHIETNCPEIAKSTGTFQAHWIWRANVYGDNDSTSLGDIVTKISPVLGISRNGFWYTFEQYRYPLQVREAKMSLLPPCRVPFGTLSIKNDFNDGRIISNIQFFGEKGDTCFTSYGNFDYEKQCVASVPVGTYEISFETRDRQGTKKNYTLSDGTFEVRRRNQQNDVATLNTSTSFKEVSN